MASGLEILRPNGVGAETSIPSQYPDDGEDHWKKVDEATPNDGTDYVFSGVDDVIYRDLYDIPPHSEGDKPVYGIQVKLRAYAATSRYYGCSIKTHNTIYDTGLVTNAFQPPTPWRTTPDAYLALFGYWQNNPFTGERWTWDEIDALEIGLRIKTSWGPTRPTKCSTVWLHVEYEGTPEITTEDATDVSRYSATLNGYLDDHGYLDCTCYFEWGLTDSYGNTTTPQTLHHDPYEDELVEGLTGLSSNRIYHFRAVATNTHGATYGEDKTFTTLEAPAAYAFIM